MCQDINECLSPGNDTCGNHTCVNVPGRYRCECVGHDFENIIGLICVKVILGPDKVVITTNFFDLEIAIAIIIVYVVYNAILMEITILTSCYKCIKTEPYYDSDAAYDDDHPDNDDTNERKPSLDEKDSDDDEEDEDDSEEDDEKEDGKDEDHEDEDDEDEELYHDVVEDDDVERGKKPPPPRKMSSRISQKLKDFF